MSTVSSSTPLFRRPTTWIAIAVFFAVFGLIGVGAYQYQSMRKELEKLKAQVPTSSSLSEERQRQLLSEVSARILLPQDETPTIAMVSDIDRLKDQPFFAGGQNGDVVLIYMNAKKAILYRPSEKKVIEVAPINLDNVDGMSQATVSGALNQQKGNSAEKGSIVSTQSFRFEIRNGTTDTALTRMFEREVLKKFPNASVIERGNASKRDYTTSFIVDISGTKSNDLRSIASALNLSPSSLPDGEQSPANADFLIILGSDKY